MNKVRIENLFCTRTGDYQDQFYRPLTTHLDADLITRFRNDTFDGSSISTSTLGNVAGDILRPSTSAKSQVHIDNGWGEERMSFILVVEEGSAFSIGNTVRVIHGYTDRYEPTLNGLIPEDTRFYFNSEVVYRTTTTERHGKVKEDLMFLGAHQILRGQSEGERQETGTHLDLVTVRPEDVFSYHMTEGIQKRTMRANNIRGQVVANFNERGRQINSIDNSSRFGRGSELKLNRRTDVSAPSYLTNLLHGFRAVVNDPNAQSFTDTDLYGSALRKTENPSIATNMFLAELRKTSAHLIRDGYVTLQELIDAFPETDDVTVLPNPSDRITHNRFNRHNSEVWHRRDNIGVAASMIKQILPSIATTCLLQTVGFSVDSDPIDGYIITPFPNAVSGLSDKVDLRKAFTDFQDRITTMLLNPLTFNGLQSIELDVMMDLVGSTEISISLDGCDVVDFTSPTYCDGLDSAMLDEDDSNLLSVAKDINHLIFEGTDWSERTGADTGHFLADVVDDDDDLMSPYGGNSLQESLLHKF